MQLLDQQNSAVMDKTLELCQTITEDDAFQALQKQVMTFLEDDEARLQYQSVHERGQELNHKQQSGVELGEAEIADFEEARQSLMDNEKVTDFMAAQQSLQELQQTVAQYVGLTLELGKVPTEDDIRSATGGCCGGSGGGGCGC